MMRDPLLWIPTVITTAVVALLAVPATTRSPGKAGRCALIGGVVGALVGTAFAMFAHLRDWHWWLVVLAPVMLVAAAGIAALTAAALWLPLRRLLR